MELKSVRNMEEIPDFFHETNSIFVLSPKNVLSGKDSGLCTFELVFDSLILEYKAIAK